VTGLVLLAVGLVVSDGADRRPADPSKPIVLRGATTPFPAEHRSLRVASFNIHSGKGGDNHRDLNRTQVVLDHELDFAGLQEVRATPWSSRSDQAAELGHRLGLASAFVPTERHWWQDHFGNALLTRWPLGGVLRIPLPCTRGKAFRNAVLVNVPLGDRNVKFLVTHIDREGDREAQLKLVVDCFLALDPPAVLMGDLNSLGTDPQLVALRARSDVRSALHDGMPGGPPDDTIDWLFHRGLKTVSAHVVEVTASDHPVLFAELALPDETASPDVD
jgi:endonuclease/exonuclease/phosphatase family metal-dependent hydrolase